MNAVMSEDFVPRHRFTVQDYYRMAEVGLLAPDARVELIDGEVIDMVPQGAQHAGILSRLTRRLVLAAGESAILRPQCPLRLDDFSEPGHAGVADRPDGVVRRTLEVHCGAESRGRRRTRYPRDG